MKKLLVVIVIFAILIGLGIGLGAGLGKGSQKGEQAEDKKQEQEQKKDGKEEHDNKKDTMIAITVAESEYFYQNERIELEDLMKELESIKDEYMVQVKDDNASWKAYNVLLDELNERKIRFVEE